MQQGPRPVFPTHQRLLITEMMIFSLAFASLAVLMHSSIVHAKVNGTSSALNNAAKAIGKKYFGTATDNHELTDAKYVAMLQNSSIFGQITPGNSMKWDTTEPQQGVFNFAGGDTIVDLAQKNGQLVRGHNLVWYNQLPSWVKNGQWTKETLTSVLQNHIHTEASHYAGKVYSWDVINEPFDDNGAWRSNVFYDTLGKSYISIALNSAHAADPKAKLYINDYNIESKGPKIDAMVQLVKDLQAEGVHIDGIGFESHLLLNGVSASDLKTNMERITALGLEVAVTELDIRIKLPATDADLMQQKTDYMEVVKVCVGVLKCVGVTVWDYTDKYSWIDSTFPGYGKALPWDANFVAKPAMDGISTAFGSSSNNGTSKGSTNGTCPSG